MKFCGGLIYGANSGEMLRWAAQSMRLGPWMKAYGRKVDLTSRIDAGFNESSVPPKPILPPPASAKAPVKWQEPARISKAPTPAIDTPKKSVNRCEWREKFLQRKRLRGIFGGLCRNSSDDSLGLKVRMIEKPTVVKKGRWWTLLGRRS
jgi:hypothetical protein